MGIDASLENKNKRLKELSWLTKTISLSYPTIMNIA